MFLLQAVWKVSASSELLILAYRGGIRGIAELEVLSEIQKLLGAAKGPLIPIQAFFDLIVGTR